MLTEEDWDAICEAHELRARQIVAEIENDYDEAETPLTNEFLDGIVKQWALAQQHFDVTQGMKSW